MVRSVMTEDQQQVVDHVHQLVHVRPRPDVRQEVIELDQAEVLRKEWLEKGAEWLRRREDVVALYADQHLQL